LKSKYLENLFNLSPAEFILQLENVNEGDVVSLIAFDKINAIKILFLNIHKQINNRNYKEVEKIIYLNISKIISENRLRQFKIYWIRYLDSYGNYIPKAVVSIVDQKIIFFESLLGVNKAPVADISVLLEIAHLSILYYPSIKSLFHRYLKATLNSFEMAKIPAIDIFKEKVLLATYGAVLDKEVGEDILLVCMNLNFLNGNHHTYQSLASYLNVPMKQHSNHKKKPFYSSSPKMTKFLNDKKYSSNFEMNNLNLKKAAKLELYCDSSIENLLRAYVVNKDSASALGEIYKNLTNNSLEKEALVILIEVLFDDGNLIGVRNVFKVLFENARYFDNKFYLAIILKKLLIRNKQFKDARSISKLIQGISE